MLFSTEMISSFESELSSAVLSLDDNEKNVTRDVSVATGEAAAELIMRCSEIIEKTCDKVRIRVYPVKNEFFGGEVTVTGLLTGSDLLRELKGKNLGEELILCSTMLRAEGDLFLDGMTPDELSEKLDCNIVFTEENAESFLYSVLGLE